VAQHPGDRDHAAGPFHNWPSEIGFEYFYGFLAGEAIDTVNVRYTS